MNIYVNYKKKNQITKLFIYMKNYVNMDGEHAQMAFYLA